MDLIPIIKLNILMIIITHFKRTRMMENNIKFIELFKIYFIQILLERKNNSLTKNKIFQFSTFAYKRNNRIKHIIVIHIYIDIVYIIKVLIFANKNKFNS